MTTPESTPEAIARRIVFHTLSNVDILDEYDAIYGDDAPRMTGELENALHAWVSALRDAVDVDGTLREENTQILNAWLERQPPEVRAILDDDPPTPAA